MSPGQNHAATGASQRFYFGLQITRAEFLKYYQGVAARVVVRCHDGRSLSLPVARLRAFVTPSGINGQFCLTVDGANKMVSLERLAQR